MSVLSVKLIVMSSFVLFSCFLGTLFTAYPYKGAGCNAASDVEAFPNQVTAIAAAAERENTLRGRKMVVDQTDEEKAKRNVRASGEVMRTNSRISSKAAKEHHKKVYTRSTEEDQEVRRNLQMSNNKNVGNFAFTADYHGPRHHPPKNN